MGEGRIETRERRRSSQRSSALTYRELHNSEQVDNHNRGVVYVGPRWYLIPFRVTKEEEWSDRRGCGERT